MRRYTRTSLGLLGLALIAPITASAQDVAQSAPAGYRPYVAAAAPVAAPSVTPVGLDGQAMPAPAPAPSSEPFHRHSGRTLCAKCAAKQAGAMPPGKIVGCAHSRNGICSACRAALNMPGQFVTMPATSAPATSAPAAEAPGRATVASASNLDSGMGEPAPVGVVQANFSQSSAPMGASMSFAPQVSQPGRAVAESMPGRDPYQANGGKAPRPHILGHLFGWSGIGAERAEEKARRKSESHAMISYDTNGNSSMGVEDLPASAVYGKKP